MATRTAKLRVELDGEKEYKQAISELNKGNQVLASEMRKLQAEYKGNEKSIEALNAKSDLLQRQLSQQKDKVSTLREALANAAKQYGEADKRTQEWQIKLNDAEAAQAKLEHQIDETNTEIKQQGEAVDEESGKMVSLGDAVDQVAGKLGVKLPEGARKALDGMNGLSAGSVAAMGAIAAAVAVVIKAVKELDALTLESAKKADDLLTQSMTSGISTDLLQQFQYAAPYIDVSADTMVGALKKIGNTTRPRARPRPRERTTRAPWARRRPLSSVWASPSGTASPASCATPMTSCRTPCALWARCRIRRSETPWQTTSSARATTSWRR